MTADNWWPADLYTDEAIGAAIRISVSDLNDLLRLASRQGLVVMVGTDKMQVNASGVQLDPISIEITRPLR